MAWSKVTAKAAAEIAGGALSWMESSGLAVSRSSRGALLPISSRFSGGNFEDLFDCYQQARTTLRLGVRVTDIVLW